MPVELFSGTTAVRLYCNGDGRIADSPEISIYPFLRQYLTEYEYDPRERKKLLKYQYFQYDRETGILHLPINITHELTSYITYAGSKFVMMPTVVNPSVSFDANYFGDFEKREYQENAIDFLLLDKYMKALSLQTGLGKTSIAIRVLFELKLRGIIVLPASLVNQWLDVFNSVSDAKIVTIRGNKAIRDIIDSNYEIEGDIFLASINTLYEYALNNSQYSGLPSFQEFIRGTKVGVKIVDECHLNFYANTMIDIQSDILHNIYLSATHMRSAANSEAIFRRIYPEHIRYQGPKTENYINITEVRFSVGDIDKRLYEIPRGYSHFKYEKYLLKRIGRFGALVDKVLDPIVNEYFIRIRSPGQKLLILVALTDFGKLIEDWLCRHYPELKTSTYFNNTSDEVLETADILISTIGSCGTGKDIPGLRTMILTTSFAAETQTLQTIGRLRRMKDTPEFVYLVNTAVGPQIRHAAIRRNIYKGIAKKFNSLVY